MCLIFEYGHHMGAGTSHKPFQTLSQELAGMNPHQKQQLHIPPPRFFPAFTTKEGFEH